jgi:hypothetical protein
MVLDERAVDTDTTRGEIVTYVDESNKDWDGVVAMINILNGCRI